MKKNDTDIRDIYRSEDPKTEPEPGWKTQELIEREMRRRLIFNISVGLLVVVLTVFLVITVTKDFLPEAPQMIPAKEKTQRVAAYTLPEDEQWALEYRQVASQAEGNEPSGPKAFSTKWVKNTAYHIIMGEQALRLNEPAAAQDHFEAATETFPAMTGIHRPLGAVYLKRQYFEKAAEQLKKALEEQPSVDVLNNLGVAYMGVEDYVQAETCLRQALQLQPELAGCYKNLALLYQKTGRTDAAAASFEKYFLLNPQDTTLIKNYVAYLTAAGRTRVAIDFLKQLKGADPLTVNLLLAKTAAQEEDADLAVSALQEVTRFITPRQTIAEMHDAAFEKISRTESYEALLYRLELAAVSLSTNFDAKSGPKH